MKHFTGYCNADMEPQVPKEPKFPVYRSAIYGDAVMGWGPEIHDGYFSSLLFFIGYTVHFIQPLGVTTVRNVQNLHKTDLT